MGENTEVFKNANNRPSQKAVDNLSDNFTFLLSKERESYLCEGIAQFLGVDVLSIYGLANYEEKTPSDFIGHYLLNLVDGRRLVMQVKGPYEEKGEIKNGGIDTSIYQRADRGYRLLEEINGPVLVPMVDGSLVAEHGKNDIAFTNYRDGTTAIDVVNTEHLFELGALAGRMKMGIMKFPLDFKREILEVSTVIDKSLKDGADFVFSCEEKKKNYLEKKLGQDSLENLHYVAELIKNGDLEIVHGDLLPGNILILDTGEFVPLDFDNFCSTTRPKNYEIGLIASRYIYDDKNYKDLSLEEKASAFQVILDGYNENVSSEYKLTFDDLMEACSVALACKIMNNIGKRADPYGHPAVEFHINNFNSFIGSWSDLKLKRDALYSSKPEFVDDVVLTPI